MRLTKLKSKFLKQRNAVYCLHAHFRVKTSKKIFYRSGSVRQTGKFNIKHMTAP